MPNLNNLSIGGFLFLIGAIIYIVNLILNLAKKSALPIDGTGLMILGIGLVLVLKM